MPYSADFSLATNQTFLNQLQMSMVHAAVQIVSEAATTKNTIDLKRNALAKAVLNGPTTYLNPFAFACVETGLAGTPTDAQVDTAVSSIWNGMAGVTSHDA